MDPFTVTAVVGLTALVATAVYGGVQSARLRIWSMNHRWTRAAERLGLQPSPATALRYPTLSGSKGELTVSIRVDHDGDRIVYEATGVPPGVALGSERVAAAVRYAGADHQVGIPAFDAAVRVGGAEREAVTLLFDPDLRALALRVFRDGDGVMEDGTLTFSVRGKNPSRAALVEGGRLLLELATAIEKRMRVPESKRLERAMKSREGTVAQRALELLVEAAPEAASTMEACADFLLEPRTPEARLLAATHAGDAGLVHLEQLFRDERETPVEVRAAALGPLVARSSRETSGALLEEALRDRARPVRLAAIRVVHTLRGMNTSRLAALARHPGVDVEEQLAIAAAFTELGGEHAEGALLSLLAAEDADVRMAAANGLALHGTIAAVVPLRDAAEAAGFREGALKSAAIDAVSAIQARIPESAVGGLALATAESDAPGAVSLADTRGALSPAAKDDEDPE